MSAEVFQFPSKRPSVMGDVTFKPVENKTYVYESATPAPVVSFTGNTATEPQTVDMDVFELTHEAVQTKVIETLLFYAKQGYDGGEKARDILNLLVALGA